MASVMTVDGVVAAVIAAPPSPANWLTAGYINGRVKVNLDFYIGTGNEAAGSTILMGQILEQGAKILSIDVITSAATSSLTISVGDAASTTRYASASSGPASAGTTSYTGMFDATNGWYVVGTNANDNQLQLLTGGATLGSGTIYAVRINFVTD